jgi:protein-disulfide isomerase
MTLAVAWLAASMTLVVLFPREQPFSAAEPGAASAAPAETLTAEQMLEWEQFLDSAPRVSELEPAGDAKVRLVKFNDYQCPYCRETWAAYRPLIAKYEASHPGVFVYESRDFPLEPECGLGGSHGMACEAAAAVRMARATNSEREMEIWLFEHQSFEMTRDEVKQGLLDVARISDFDEQYPAIVGEIRDDVQLALKLGVDGTPTFYVNGINIGAGLRPSYLDAAIEYELSKAGVDAQVAVDLQDR